MARKSRDSMLRDRLLSISKCPFDIFDQIEEAEAFSLLERCESGDPSAVLLLTKKLFDGCCGRSSEALVYLLGRGIALGLAECAEMAASYIASGACDSIELARSALTLSDGAPDGDMLYLYAMVAIADADVPLVDASLLSNPEYAGALYYLLPEGDGRIAEVKRLAGLFDGCSDSVEGLSVYFRWLDRFPIPAWRDRWLGWAYEYALKHGEVQAFARLAYRVIAERSYCERHLLYLYAASSIGNPEAVKENERLLEQCIFEGIECENLDTGAVLREAVYIDSALEIERAKARKAIGGRIIHTKNRYSLTHTLTGHSKRAKLHFWETRLSIKTEHKPTFSEIKIEQVRYTPMRNGIEIEGDGATCQLLCRSEITVNDTRHPFILDLLADISYISATKCQSIEIREGEVTQNGDLITVCVQLFLK